MEETRAYLQKLTPAKDLPNKLFKANILGSYSFYIFYVLEGFIYRFDTRTDENIKFQTLPIIGIYDAIFYDENKIAIAVVRQDLSISANYRNNSILFIERVDGNNFKTIIVIEHVARCIEKIIFIDDVLLNDTQEIEHKIYRNKNAKISNVIYCCETTLINVHNQNDWETRRATFTHLFDFTYEIYRYKDYVYFYTLRDIVVFDKKTLKLERYDNFAYIGKLIRFENYLIISYFQAIEMYQIYNDSVLIGHNDQLEHCNQSEHNIQSIHNIQSKHINSKFISDFDLYFRINSHLKIQQIDKTKIIMWHENFAATLWIDNEIHLLKFADIKNSCDDKTLSIGENIILRHPDKLTIYKFDSVFVNLRRDFPNLSVIEKKIILCVFLSLRQFKLPFEIVEFILKMI